MSYFIMHVALRFGEQNLWLRTASAFASLLMVALLYRFVGRIWGRGGGAVAASLLAVSAYHVSIAQMASPYALFGLVALLSFHSLFRALKNNRYDAWIGYAVNIGLCLSAYSLAVFVLCSQILVTVLYLWLPPSIGNARGRLANFCLAVTTVIAAFAAMLSVANLLTEALAWGGRVVESAAFVAPAQASVYSSSDSLLQFISNADAWQLSFVALAIVGAVLAFRHDNRFSWMMAAWAIVPAVPTLAYRAAHDWTLFGPDTGPSYVALIVFIAVGILVMGKALAKGLPRWRWAAWLVVVATPLLFNARQIAVYYDILK